MLKPFLKWVGGKRSILDEISSRLPNDYQQYYEPFIGGGSVLFHLSPKNAYISDINSKLIITYNEVKYNPREVIRYLNILKHKHNTEFYYKCRQLFNKENDKTKIASLFIYLNKTCFNGLYRENSNGNFNVPCGNYKSPSILSEENILEISTYLKNVEIHNHSFVDIPIKKYSFYYFDPPYYKTYNEYNKQKFTTNLHERLLNLCNEIDHRDSYFMLSNSKNNYIENLFDRYNIDTIKANRSISRIGKDRKKENELLIRNYK